MKRKAESIARANATAAKTRLFGKQCGYYETRPDFRDNRASFLHWFKEQQFYRYGKHLWS